MQSKQNLQAPHVLQLFAVWGVFWGYFQITFRMFSAVIWVQKDNWINLYAAISQKPKALPAPMSLAVLLRGLEAQVTAG